jgi:hypothetical protein
VSLEVRQTRAGWLFLLPALGLIGVFFVVPLIAGLFLSFTDFDLYAIGDPANAQFVGLGNYQAVLANPLFWKALGNTLYFVVVAGPLSVLVSLAAALLVQSKRTIWPGFFVFTPEGIQKAIELNQIIGSKYVVMASPGEVSTADSWKQVADRLNAGAEKLNSPSSTRPATTTRRRCIPLTASPPESAPAGHWAETTENR